MDAKFILKERMKTFFKTTYKNRLCVTKTRYSCWRRNEAITEKSLSGFFMSIFYFDKLIPLRMFFYEKEDYC